MLDWRQFLFGGPTPMEPDLLATQKGALPMPGQTPRMNVLPVTVDPVTGPQLALPRALDILGNVLTGGVPKIAAGLSTQRALGPAEAALAEVARLNEMTKQAYRPAAKADDLASFTPDEIASLISDAATDKKRPRMEMDLLEEPAVFGQLPEFWTDPKVSKAPEQAFAAHPSIDNWLKLPPEKQNLDMLQEWQKPMVELSDTGWKEKPIDLDQKPWTEEDAATLWMTHNPQGPAKPAVTEYIAPEDWRNRKASRMLYEEQLVGPPAPVRVLEGDRLARAAEMGFDTSNILYTGVPTWGEVKPLGFKDPITRRKDEKAVFLSGNPDIAGRYVGEGVAGPGYSGGVMPVFMRSEKPFEYNWRGEQYDAQLMESLIDEALAGGYDSAVMKNMRDLGGLQDQYLAFNPNQLRSIFAKFDPKNIAANDLTAALAVMFGAGAVTQGGKDAK
jgi:hypothetical protein